MSIALSEFWTRLVRSGLADTDDCKRIAVAFGKATGAPPADPVSLAKFLVRAGRLTRFQARTLVGPQPELLRIGPFLRRDERAAPPLGQWIPVAPADRPGNGLLLTLGANVIAVDPTIKQALQIKLPGLQSFKIVVGTDQQELVYSPLPPGRSLRDLLETDEQLSERSRLLAIGIQVGEVLAAMHAQNLNHGAVRPDRIWITAGGDAIVLRDPAAAASSSLTTDSGGWLETLEPPDAYRAPEAFTAGHVDDPAGDVYAIGCLLFRLHSGRNLVDVVDAKTEFEWRTVQCTAIPPELSAAVQAGERGDPLLRVIAHATAKNAHARFANAAKLVAALKHVREMELKQTASAPGPAAAATPASPKPADQPMQTARPQPDPPTTAAQRDRGAASHPVAEPQPQNAVPAPPAEPTTAPPESAPPEPQDQAIPTPSPEPGHDDSPETTSAASSQTTGEPTRAARPSRIRRRRKKSSRAPLVLGALGVTALMLVIAVLVYQPGPGTKPDKPPPRYLPPEQIPAVVTERSQRTETDAQLAQRASNSPSGFQELDDERLLWAPPFPPGESPSTRLLPPGPGIIVTIRLADLVSSPSGQSLLKTFSPELANLIETTTARAKVPAESIERLTVALHPVAGGWPETSLAVELTEPQPLEQLSEAWNAFAAQTPTGATIFSGDEPAADAYFPVAELSAGGDANNAPTDDTDEMVAGFAVGSVARIGEVAENEGLAIPLPISLQRLWDASSQQAHVVGLVTPNFLFADARDLLSNSAPQLVEPLKKMLVPDTSAWSFAFAVLDDKTYLETRLLPSGGVSEAQLLRQLDQTIARWPRWAEQFLLDAVPDPSWRLLAIRLPQMMQFVVDHTRFGIASGVVTANIYLPGAGAEQVGLSVLLALNTPAGGPATEGPMPSPASPLTIAEMLEQPLTVSFDQESLEFAIQTIVEEFSRALPRGSTMPAVRLLGSDLEQRGITQNQQIRDFVQQDVPLRGVLTSLVLGANPDKSATGPSDPKQQLVWVVADDPESPGQQAILVTTRQAATDRYELPSEFRP